jgi:hypothetical protein
MAALGEMESRRRLVNPYWQSKQIHESTRSL